MIPPLLVTFFTFVTYGGVARCNHIALTTRLLRTYVQMEIKEASRHNCNMITVFESEERKQGFFDYGTGLTALPSLSCLFRCPCHDATRPSPQPARSTKASSGSAMMAGCSRSSPPVSKQLSSARVGCPFPIAAR